MNIVRNRTFISHAARLSQSYDHVRALPSGATIARKLTCVQAYLTDYIHARIGSPAGAWWRGRGDEYRFSLLEVPGVVVFGCTSKYRWIRIGDAIRQGLI